ncbi:MAG: DUF72 domain-containing protein [Synergistaceae bacterium]|jgi:uncharacterized protein YecE (DUF72 family)|nr:DUF72 domain-containing protein [Synergistaceae bacterium]
MLEAAIADIREKIRVGTCSWTDKTLLKSGFYPPSATTPASRLAHYSGIFSTVEVDSTYYALPDPGNIFRWLAGTPKNFTFGVKAFSVFTFHRAKLASLPPWLREELGSRGGVPRDASALVRREDLTSAQRKRLFEEFVSPVRILHDSGRLAYLLFQFPPYWKFSREGLVYFRRLREESGPMPLAVEVRNNSWFAPGNDEKFIKALEAENIAYAAVDEPDIGWTVGTAWPITAEWGTLARFHGRNSAGWRNRRASVYERFDYEYSPSELEEWVFRIKDAMKAKIVYLMYNNCVGDKAVNAALTMMEMLGLPTAGLRFPRQKNLL